MMNHEPPIVYLSDYIRHQTEIEAKIGFMRELKCAYILAPNLSDIKPCMEFNKRQDINHGNYFGNDTLLGALIFVTGVKYENVSRCIGCIFSHRDNSSVVEGSLRYP